MHCSQALGLEFNLWNWYSWSEFKIKSTGFKTFFALYTLVLTTSKRFFGIAKFPDLTYRGNEGKNDRAWLLKINWSTTCVGLLIWNMTLKWHFAPSGTYRKNTLQKRPRKLCHKLRNTYFFKSRDGYGCIHFPYYSQTYLVCLISVLGGMSILEGRTSQI